MTVTELTDRFGRLESRISTEKGGFSLFALFQREDVPDRWDLIVAAPWVMSDRDGALDYFIEKIKSVLGAQELINLSRIVFADPDDASVADLNRAIRVEHGGVEVRDSTFFGLPVKHALIITSKEPAAVAG